MSTTPTAASSFATAAARAAHVARGVAETHPFYVARAEGARVWDTDGREYLDFVGGIGVLNTGHRHPKVVEAAKRQLDAVMHTCYQVASYDVYTELAARLNALVSGGPNKTLLLTTGVEATENAVKIARGYTNRPAVIAFNGAFHGRTLLGLSMTASSTGYKQNFGPFASEVYHTPFPYEYRGITSADALKALQYLFDTRVMPSQVAAIIIEPQLGEGGFVPAPAEFMRELRRICTAHGIVLIADEIQCGFGRTGKMWAYEHSGIEPDLVTMAKSLGGGLPLSAVTGKAAIMDAPAAGGLGGTYAGNPVACAAALAVLDVFRDERVLEQAERQAAQMEAALGALKTAHPQVGDVRGLGAMKAIEIVKPADLAPDSASAQKIVDLSRARGLLLLKSGTAKNVIRLLPPLTTPADELGRGLDVLAGVCREVFA
ncbi:MAG: 4-aminobutyrate--2-oxoglutarate transaminase [Acidobacteria bacterium]|nr:4-aminobutyrate--2-oxoglutarate transaminase [Acidobacteriota bacterium]